MWLSELQDYDYKVLEEYWSQYKELVTEKSESEVRRCHVENVVAAIEKLYNESGGVMRELIEMVYFDSIAGAMDPKHIAEQLNITQHKLSNMRKGLMKDTAELIGYV